MFTCKLNNGQEVPIPLCIKCNTEAFAPDSWTKLHGQDPRTPGRVGKTSDPCFDGNVQYTIFSSGGDHLPDERGPILRIRRPVREIVESSTLCGLCRVVSDLDTKSGLQSGDFEKAVIDLQLFKAERYSGVYLPALLSVKLELETDAEHKTGKKMKFSNRTLLAMLTIDAPEEEEVDGHLAPIESTGSEETVSFGEVGQSGDCLDELLDEVRQWMQTCEADHEACNLSREPLLPMRALHLQAHGDSYTVELIDFRENRKRGRYVALSYVWGTTPIRRLVTDTIKDFMSGISYEELPKTMQDAVRVTQALGISYLWIDALCIMQDDDGDKELQIPYMNEYYRNAAVVISASGALDAHMGFLSWQPTARDVLRRWNNQTVTDSSSSEPLPFRIPVHYPFGMFLMRLVVQPSLYNYQEEPINKRGWTLQESRLARRLLIFPATGGIIAQCSNREQAFGQVLSNPFFELTGSAYRGEYVYDDTNNGEIDSEDEDGNDSEEKNEGRLQQSEHSSVRSIDDALATDITDKADNQAKEEVLDNRNCDGARDDMSEWSDDEDMANREVKHESRETEEQRARNKEIETIFRDWIGTVQDYSRRSLSEPGDILVAIGALAQEFHIHHHSLLGAYAAGLWQGALRQGLLWHASAQRRQRLDQDDDAGMFPRGTQIPPFLAPSWSWASCARPVTFRTFIEPNYMRFFPVPDLDKEPEEPRWYVEIVDCATSLKSESDIFGAVQSGYMDMKGTLLPIKRVSKHRRRLSKGDKISLVLDGEYERCLTELVVADTAKTLTLIDDTCYWLPVFYATRRRSRGLIVRRRVDGSFRRLGFAEMLNWSPTFRNEERVLRLV